MEEIKETDPCFFDYLDGFWLKNTGMWAAHCLRGVVHMDNLTNNRVENAHGHLKRHVHCRMHVATAMRKIWDYVGYMVRTFEAKTIMSDRRLLLQPGFVGQLLSRLTVYAAKKVVKNLKEQFAAI